MSQKAFGSAQFTETLLCLENSRTYRKLCRIVHGQDLCQLNVLDEEQLQTLISVLKDSAARSVLDLGCGTGFISEYISDSTDAHVVGVDFSAQAGHSMTARTKGKSDQLTFVCQDLNRLCLEFKTFAGLKDHSFDAIISIDSFYFIDDLAARVRDFKKLLKPGGLLAAFYSYKRKNLNESLNPRKNRLGSALTAAGFSFTTKDFSTNEKEIWEKTREVAHQLKAEFEAEGNLKLYESRVAESERTLSFISQGLSARAFYLALNGD